MPESLTLTVDRGVAHLKMTRAQQANSFDLPSAEALDQAVRQIEGDDAIRVVLLTGEGRRFSAGGDITSMVAAADPSAYLQKLANTLDGALQRLDLLAKPVVVAVQGAVAGAGLGVMLTGDIIVAEHGTSFLTAYAGVGLTPDCGVSWLLPRTIGQPRALQMLLSGTRLDADQALSWGLVTEVVEGDAAQRAEQIALALAAGPAGALGQARRLVRSSWSTDRVSSGADEARTIAAAVTTPDAVAALSKFIGS